MFHAGGTQSQGVLKGGKDQRTVTLKQFDWTQELEEKVGKARKTPAYEKVTRVLTHSILVINAHRQE